MKIEYLRVICAEIGANAPASFWTASDETLARAWNGIGPEHCTLVMEEGNHFTDNAGRLARAFAWCIERI